MKPISGKRFSKIVERKGWTLLRIQGSHYIYGKSGSNIRLTIPIQKKVKISNQDCSVIS